MIQLCMRVDIAFEKKTSLKTNVTVSVVTYADAGRLATSRFYTCAESPNQY